MMSRFNAINVALSVKLMMICDDRNCQALMYLKDFNIYEFLLFIIKNTSVFHFKSIHQKKSMGRNQIISSQVNCLFKALFSELTLFI